MNLHPSPLPGQPPLRHNHARYDEFGNISKSGTLSFLPTYDTNNHYSSLPGVNGPFYDANGNLIFDGVHRYSWDADGNSVGVDSTTVLLSYDALGRMVEQARGSNYTQVAYSPEGTKLALMNAQQLQKAYVPLTAQATAVFNGGGLTYYRHPDWLGSSRLATTPARTMYSDVAYAPYGEPYAQAGTPDYSFTGKNQDTLAAPNIGLYDFPTRELRFGQGRWLSPDPAGLGSTSLEVPQSLNRYAYADDDPTTSTDPSGLCTIFVAGVKDRPGNAGFENAAADVGGVVVYPYKDHGLVGGILEVAARAILGPDATTQQVANEVNAMMADPNGIQIVAYSGGAQSFSTAVRSGQVSASANDNITDVIYLSPGIGPFGHLSTNKDFRNATVSSFHGGGFVDFLATFNTRLSGADVGSTVHGANGQSCGHNFQCEFNSSDVAQVKAKLTPCPDVLPALPLTHPGQYFFWLPPPGWYGGNPSDEFGVHQFPPTPGCSSSTGEPCKW